mmetsp:Transcript_21075/g.31048  ORF Transcript_21075/g.31048 Transcript_21075/m.31048 type:complete len:82 (-) Transcript_21075:546-791(-)
MSLRIYDLLLFDLKIHFKLLNKYFSPKNNALVQNEVVFVMHILSKTKVFCTHLKPTCLLCYFAFVSMVYSIRSTDKMTTGD